MSVKPRYRGRVDRDRLLARDRCAASVGIQGLDRSRTGRALVGTERFCHRRLRDGYQTRWRLPVSHALARGRRSSQVRRVPGDRRAGADCLRIRLVEAPDGRPGHETLITVTFEELGTKTRLTLRQSGFDTATNCQSHVVGWTSCLERFGEYMITV